MWGSLDRPAHLDLKLSDGLAPYILDGPLRVDFSISLKECSTDRFPTSFSQGGCMI